MQLFWRTLFLLLCQTIQEWECQIIVEDAKDTVNGTDLYDEPMDFRCLRFALVDFDFDEHFNTIGYAIVIDDHNKQLGCTGYAKTKYPRLTGTDPMMPYYINTLHRGIPLAKDSDSFMFTTTPLKRTKEYCAGIEVHVSAFLEYWEKFHSEIDLCTKMVDIITMCYEFLQMRDMFVTKLYDKLCLSEDGCYNVMDYYEEELPFCVKHTAINAFKNSSAGSWHHTIINYCKLTEMVPETKAEKYDQTIIKQKGRRREMLTKMCLYLRYRLLPEEGKEQKIPDLSDSDYYDPYDSETTTEHHSGGITILLTVPFWNVVPLIAYL